MRSRGLDEGDGKKEKKEKKEGVVRLIPLRVWVWVPRPSWEKMVGKPLMRLTF